MCDGEGVEDSELRVDDKVYEDRGHGEVIQIREYCSGQLDLCNLALNSLSTCLSGVFSGIYPSRSSRVEPDYS
jgi:hypothetical protein